MTVPTEGQLSSYERSLRDLDEGRVNKYDCLDDLIKEIEGWARQSTYNKRTLLLQTMMDMKIFKILLVTVLCVFLSFFIDADPMYLIFLAIPFLSFIFYLILKRYKPQWFNERWPYMTDEEKREFLRENKRRK